MQLWCSEACGRCCLRSRSSPPLPKTTVLGAAVGALGARKALTPVAHASATISRAMIAAERSTRCYNDDGTGGCDVDLAILPPPPCRPQTPPFRQDRVLCAMHELSPAQRGLDGPARTAPPPRLSRHGCTSPGPASERLERYAEARLRARLELSAWGCLQAPQRASIDQRSVRARLIAHSSLRKAAKR